LEAVAAPLQKSLWWWMWGKGEWVSAKKNIFMKSKTPGAYTENRRADFSKFLFVLIQIDIKMMKKGI
jgi:hypothetical protein